jgi:5-formyltetrahydrofolate cyclo-ligase
MKITKIKENKQQLRSQNMQKRQALSNQEWREKSELLCDNLLHLSIFQKAQTILAYFSFKKEPDLSLLYTNSQKKWGFPRCKKKELIWHFWTSENKRKKRSYGLNEPDSNLPLIKAEEVDLILIPAVACDYQKFRLGYGGGYYDRMLIQSQWQNIPTIGIVFDFAYLPQIPTEKWDQKLDFVCTDLRFY